MKFFIKNIQAKGSLSSHDCLTLLEETEEGFVDWLGTIEGEFSLVSEMLSYEYDFRFVEHAIYIVYESERDAFAHKMRWHRTDRVTPRLLR